MYTTTTKNKALALYVMGYTVTQVTEATGVPSSTISSWITKGKWEQLKKDTSLITQESVVSNVSREVAEDTRRHLGIYRKMQDKGLEDLDDKGTRARTTGEAAEVADRGIKGERSIASGLVSRKLISIIARIVTEEVTDETTRQRIAIRIREELAGVID